MLAVEEHTQKHLDDDNEVYLTVSDCQKICKVAKCSGSKHIPVLITHDDTEEV